MSDARALRGEIESLLYREAALLDGWKLQEWLGLYTEDCIYWIPCNEDDNDPRRHISIAYDNRENLQDRIWRLDSGKAWSQEPRSRTRRLVSNVELLESKADEATVSSSFALFQSRMGRQNTYAGRYEHRLRKVEGAWKITYKKVELINNNDTIDDLTFLL